MAATIDLTIKVDLAQVADTHDHLTAMAKSLTGWSDDVNGQRSKALGDWEGASANAFGNTASFYRNDLDDLQKTVTTLGNAVNTFHSSVTSVKNACADMLDEARKAKLMVSGSIITLPDSPTFIGAVGAPLPASAQQQLSAYGDMKKKFEDLAKRAKDQGKDLAEAHTKLQEACEKVEAPRGIPVKKPKEPGEGTKSVFESLEKGENFADLLKGGIQTMLGEFGPHGAHVRGLFNDFTLKSMQDLDNWVPGEGHEGAWKVAEGAENAAKYLKIAGYVGAGVTAFIDGKKQWNIDSHDPSLSTSAHITRAVVTGVADAAPGTAGGWAGAEVGAEGGAALFTVALGPEAAPVGAVVGGIAGAIGGAKVADKVYDHVKDSVHHLISHLHW